MALENETNRDIVLLTGQPVSDELQDILDRCEKGIEVSIEEVVDTPEMIAAASCVSHQTPTIQLKGREAIEENVFNILNNYGSVKVDDKGDSVVDSHGNTVYNEDVEQGSRLDIVIGLPASGKSSAIVDKISYEHKAKLIDNDEAKRLFPEFNKGWGANTVHLESQMVEREVFKAALKRHDNIVMPKVGSDADKLIKDYISLAKKEGYKVNVHYVDLDKNKTMGRMLRRFIHKGRYLSPRLIDKYVNEREGNKIAKAYEALKEMGAADGFSKWNNDVGIGEQPILVESIGLTDKFIKDARVTDETIIDNGGREYGKLNGEHSKDGQIKPDELHRRGDGRENREDHGEDKQDNSREGSRNRRNERDGEISSQYEDISRSGSRGTAVDPLYDQGIDSVYEGENPNLFKEQILTMLTSHTISGTDIKEPPEYGYSYDRSFDYIVHTYQDNKENYADIGETTEIDTVYGKMKLDSISQENEGRFNLQDNQYTGILSEESNGLVAGTMIAFTAAEVLSVSVMDKGDIITADTSRTNPDYEMMKDRAYTSDEPKTFRAYIENDKSALDVTMFHKDSKAMFYIEDTGDYPLMLGEGTMSDTFEFTPYNAISSLNEYGAGFDGSKDFIIFENIDAERTQAEINRALDMDSLPVQLNVDISLDGVPGDTKYFAFNDERDAKFFSKSFRNEMEEFSKVSGVEVTFDSNISERDDKKRELKAVVDAYEESPIVKAFRDKTNEMFHELDGANAESIEMMVKDHVQASLNEWGVDAVVLDAVLIGSRCRGLEREDSDVDVVVEFYGDISEDALSNDLKDEWIGIDGHEIDINPITKDKSGSLEEYLPKAEEYLTEKAETIAKEQAEARERAEQQAKEQAEREAAKKEKARIEEECLKEEEEKQAKSHEVASASTFANFKLEKNVDDEKYILIADVKSASGKITEGAAIAEFANKAAALAFCEKNEIEAEDITKHLQNHIEHKKHIASEKGKSDGHEDPNKSDRNRKNVGIDD